jgi:glutamyl-tRNA reductase
MTNKSELELQVSKYNKLISDVEDLAGDSVEKEYERIEKKLNSKAQEKVKTLANKLVDW